MLEVNFCARGLPYRYAQIVWARENGVPLTLSWTVMGEPHYGGTRWMLRKYAKDQYTKFGTPRFEGGILMVRQRDAALWIMRWGHTDCY